MTDYHTLYQNSIKSPESFWTNAAEDIIWTKKWDRVLDSSNAPFYRWFVGGKLNTCDNAVDRHVREGFGEQTAIIYDSPITKSQQKINYTELQQKVAQLAGALTTQGIGHGDRVIIYMPLIPEAIFSMLACARIGAVHSVVFGGFGANELAARIDDAAADFILSASCGLEPTRIIDYKTLLEQALVLTKHKVRGCAIYQRPQHICELVEGRDIDWNEFIADAPLVDCVPVEATDPLYILYTSGTTGAPKGIVRDNGGHAVALKWTMKNLYDVDSGEVFWAASDIGWIVGHSYMVYAPLFNRNTTVLYEGKPVGTPDASAFWRMISEHKIGTMFTAPTAIRAIKKEDPNGELLSNFDLSHFRTQFLAGERCDPDTIEWIKKHLCDTVVDHWWQTETGWSIATNPVGIEKFPTKAGSSTLPAPGNNLKVFNDEGDCLPCNQLGNLSIKLPLPPGSFSTIWNGQDRMREQYLSTYDGYYLTGDSGKIDEDGYVHVMSRIDDVINVAAHRLSTGQMEEVLCAHPAVAEAAVFGVADDFKGELPLGLVVINNNVTETAEVLCAALIAQMREQIGAVAAFRLVAVVKQLPKTRSGKILRGTMRKIANNEPYTIPSTIDNPDTINEITAVLESLGYPKK